MTTKQDKFSGFVYSTEHGRMCPTCSKPRAACVCRQHPSTPVGDAIVRVGRETQGRKGKGMTIITGVPLDHVELLQLGQQLKKTCATGGTVKDGVIAMQGDHRDLVVKELQKRGWTVRRSGG